ncbi:hypothetical protein V4R08_17625 (plasmid) [Nitrobacter sp. NHB1]
MVRNQRFDPPDKRSRFARPRPRAQQVGLVAMSGCVLLRRVLRENRLWFAGGRLDLRQEQRVQDLLPHERHRQAGGRRDIRSRHNLIGVHLSREVPREQEFAGKHVRFKLTPLACAVILNLLQADRRGFGRARRIDIAGATTTRHRVNSHVADLVADKQSAICVRSFVFRADGAALLVE